ncbi:RING-box protein 1a-like [Quillaja saponaria]|uniref:RING-box protein 1a-like n=1 Tax=Quillaja saponaria TaxID=32244 RepID=A0AAD7PQ10_QUISA|nr:RING-box protein 1a-like [Quillaja saponaria]
MATPMDTDVTMVPAGEGSSTHPGPSSSSAVASSSSKKPKRFEIKKWNAVALWAWISLWIIVQSVGTTSWIFALNVKLIKLVLLAKNALLLGVCATMPSISIASADGLKHVKCAHSTTVSGSSRSMATKRCI